MALPLSKRWKRSNSNPLQIVREMDFTILLPALLLAGIGVAMVFSATYSRTEFSSLYLKQMFWIGVGLVGMFAFTTMNYQVLVERYAYPLYWLVVILLAAVLAAGQEIAGSKRWLNLGFASIQPSEFAKIATVLVLAKFLSARENRLHDWQVIVGAFLLAGIPMLLILREPDLGTSLVFIPMVLAMLFTVGVPWQRLAMVVGGAVLASPMVWFLLKDYQRRRIMIFLNPNSDNLGAGYNVIQSKIAIGSGGMSGKGWLAGTQGQLKFVPEHHTDFIFAVMAEEWGLMGTLTLLLLYAVLLLQVLRVARSARDMGGSLMAVGITAILFTQVTINLGVATGILPVTGMTLPFISYGGSSVIACLGMLGVVMSIWSGRKVK